MIKEDNMIKSHNKNTSNKQKQILSQSMSNIDYTHIENNFVDFDRERLLFKMNSSEGPCLCVADFNQDGLDDIFIGSAKNQVSKIYYQIKKGEFKEYSEPFENDLLSEDVNCVVDDFDGDGRIDLIVASGGSEFSNFSPELRDRLYLNNGYMNFQKLDNSFASILTFESTSTISSDDIDNDGDKDLFVGTRLNPGSYGTQTKNFILINNGKGIFSDATSQYLGKDKIMKMVTDSEFIDIDNDGKNELVVVGEWMPILVFKNLINNFLNISDSLGLSKTNGLYNEVHCLDINNDGFNDIIIGNYGLNSMFKASVDKPLTLYVNDFDKNGRQNRY